MGQPHLCSRFDTARQSLRDKVLARPREVKGGPISHQGAEEDCGSPRQSSGGKGGEESRWQQLPLGPSPARSPRPEDGLSWLRWLPGPEGREPLGALTFQLWDKDMSASLGQIFLRGQALEIPFGKGTHPSPRAPTSPAPAVPQKSEDLFAG